MASNITIPTTGAGDATPKVKTTQVAGLEHIQWVLVGDATGAYTIAVDSAGKVPITIADGSHVTTGAKADAAWSGTGDSTVVAALKAIYARVNATGQSRTLSFASVSVASSGDNTIVAAGAGSLKNKLVSYVLVASGAVSIYWRSGTAGTALTGAMSLAANGGISAIGQPSSHLLETAAATSLVLNLSSATGVRGHIAYFQEA